MKVAKSIWIALLSLMASTASAQSNPKPNAFFGFDFVLHPVALKWACGGARDQDLAALEVLFTAFPEDAEQAELQSHIDAMLQISEGEDGVAEIIGAELTDAQAEQICRAAMPLSVVWVTPEQLVAGDEDGVPPEQRAAWAEFWQVVESLQ